MEKLIDYLIVFAVGGGICVIAQILIDKTKLTPARILVSYVTLGVILYAVGVYEPLVKFANSGATTPLLGFGYLIGKGVKEAVDEKGLLGALTGGISSASAGITAAMVFGYLSAIVFKGKAKK